MKSHVSSYMYSKGSIGLLIASTSVFIEIFILIFQPFQSRAWVNNDWQYLGWSIAMVTVAAIIMFISRFVMYAYGKKHDIPYWLFAIWVAIEMLIMTLVYCLALSLGFPEFVAERNMAFMHLYKEVFIGVIFMFFIPYIIIFLALELKEKSNEIKLLKGEIAVQNAIPEMFNFYDEKGELRLSVRPDLVFYLEGADNYVIIHYRNSGKMTKEIIRNTLKNVAWSFRELGLVRCSRSYIVNITKVKVLRKVEGEVVVDFGDEKLPSITVSKTYVNDVLEQVI